MLRQRLDSRDKLPSGMEEYLSAYGWHFSKKLCEWAVGNMTKKGTSGKEEKLSPYTKEGLDTLLKSHNITIENNIGYDALYVLNMAKADYYGSSVIDEVRLIKFVKDYLDDIDGYDGIAMTRFYADCIGSGNPIPWEDVI